MGNNTEAVKLGKLAHTYVYIFMVLLFHGSSFSFGSSFSSSAYVSIHTKYCKSMVSHSVTFLFKEKNAFKFYFTF